MQGLSLHTCETVACWTGCRYALRSSIDHLLPYDDAPCFTRALGLGLRLRRALARHLHHYDLTSIHIEMMSHEPEVLRVRLRVIVLVQV